MSAPQSVTSKTLCISTVQSQLHDSIRRLKQEHAQGHPEEVYSCEFLDASTEAMQLASCSEEKVFLWDVGTGKQLASAGPPSDIQHEPTGTLCCTLHAKVMGYMPWSWNHLLLH